MITPLLYFLLILLGIFLLFLLGFGINYLSSPKYEFVSKFFVFILMIGVGILFIFLFIYLLIYTSEPSPTVESSQPPVSPILSSGKQTTSYYMFDPNTKTLSLLALDKITNGKEIVDYYHKNDESIFLLSDGTIVSILGNNIQRYPTSPPLQKIRAVQNRYAGLSNGKMYFSSDLKTWTPDPTYTGVMDFDVPGVQNDILELNFPKENVLIDLSYRTAQKQPPSKIKYGADPAHFVKITADGVYENDQFYYPGVVVASVDGRNRYYIVPKETQNKYGIQTIFASDDKAIFKLSNANPQEKIILGNELIYK